MRKEDPVTLERQQHILFFEPSVGGHHPSYLQNLLRYAPENAPKLSFVVSQSFVVKHEDVVREAKDRGAQVITMSRSELERLNAPAMLRGPVALMWRAYHEWMLLTRYAAQVKSTDAVAMYFDPLLQFAMPMGLPAPCPVSGIYFRPTFHYSSFAANEPEGFSDRVRALRQKVAVQRSLVHRRMGALFSLDALVVPTLQALAPSRAIVALPDPVHIYPEQPDGVDNLRRRLGVPAERRVALLFGSLSSRKGLFEVLDALGQLPARIVQKLSVLIVGTIAPDQRAVTQARLAALRERDPHLVVVHDAFVADEDVQLFFGLADVVLAPYQRHVGSSGIQIRAARAAKPILGPSYGLMGELTRRYGLGATIDTRRPSAIADALVAFVDGRIETDDVAQRAFAESNSAESFAHVFYATMTQNRRDTSRREPA